jgi:hypothetical protein
MFESLLQSVLGEHLGGHTFAPQLGEGGYRRMLTRFRRPYRPRRRPVHRPPLGGSRQRPGQPDNPP